MGTKVDCKHYLPLHCSMRDLNEDSSSCTWASHYRDKTIKNEEHCNGFMPLRTTIDFYPGVNKDALKQKMLEHEAVFKDQVYELHRLYTNQRNMMEEVKRKGLHGIRESMEPSFSSSSHPVNVVPSGKWHMAGFPLLNSSNGKSPISGIEIVDSPLSCSKRNNKPPDQFPFQNRCSLKDSAALELRPLKVRKKLFDLQLPDECIDIEEQERLPEFKLIDTSSNSPNENLKIVPEGSRKLSVGGHTGLEIDYRVVESSSASCLRNSTGLADLNEPFVIEESITPSPVGFLCYDSTNGETEDINRPDKLNAKYFGVVKGDDVNASGLLINSVESKVYRKGYSSTAYEAGSNKSNQSSLILGLQQDKLSKTPNSVQGLLNPYPTVYGTDSLWKNGNCHGLESSDRNRDCSNNGWLSPFLASQATGSYPFFGSSYLASTLPESVSSWNGIKNGFTKSWSSLNPAAATDRCFQTSSQSRVLFGGNWPVGARPTMYPCARGELTTVDGLHQGSSSGFKDRKVHIPSAGFDYGNCSTGNLQKGPCHVGSKSVLDINLNEVDSTSSANEAVTGQGLRMRNEKTKHDNLLVDLPWVKSKSANVDKAAAVMGSEVSADASHLRASSDQSCSRAEAVGDLNEPFVPKFTMASKEIVETKNVRKILGFPIYETGASEKDPSSHVTTSARVGFLREGINDNKGSKKRIIDINLECTPDEQIIDEELTLQKEKHATVTSVREYIDLNSCPSDSEDPSTPCHHNESTSFRTTKKIDLDTSIHSDEDDRASFNQNKVGEVSLQQSKIKTEALNDGVLQNAAETIVAISSFCPETSSEEDILHHSEACLDDMLLSFANALCSHVNELESALDNELRVNNGSPNELSEEIDDFEAMTLQLPETKHEDCMPQPFVPEVLKVGEMGNSNTLPARSRRGQSRRGRQRKDFQRDILPGLVSLSRHEMTEDLQAFGGLMKATGHQWFSGLTRRNGNKNRSARGRRQAAIETVPPTTSKPVCTPLVQQLNNVQVGLEDRSLTGWGKTTRRPRRQRCPAGNLATVVIT